MKADKKTHHFLSGKFFMATKYGSGGGSCPESFSFN